MLWRKLAFLFADLALSERDGLGGGSTALITPLNLVLIPLLEFWQEEKGEGYPSSHLQ